jgi:RHS repeat-associated protein
MTTQTQKTVAQFIRKPILLFALLIVLLSSAVSSPAQQTRTPERGFSPAGSYLLSDIESISSTGGNLSFNIPLAKLPAGRAGSSAGVSLVYNSKLYDSFLDIDSGSGIRIEKLDASPHGGWRYAYDYKLHVQMRPDRALYECNELERLFSVRLLVSFPDGSTKEFRPTGMADVDGYFAIFPDGTSIDCSGLVVATTNKLTYYSIDGSYIRLDVEHDGVDGWQDNDWTLYFPDGSRAFGRNVTRNLFDRNGNEIKIRSITLPNENPAIRIFDQMEREIIIEYALGEGVDYIHQKGTNGVTMTWTINRTSLPSTDYTTTGSDNVEYTYLVPFMSAVSSITLPSQAGSLAYAFTYHTGSTQPAGYGEAASITLPTGAQASYSYQYHDHDNITAVLDNTPTQKILTYLRQYDGSSTTATETWSYSLMPSTGNPATVTGPDGGILREWIEPNRTAPDYSFGQVYKSEHPNGMKVERLWQDNRPSGGAYYVNPCVKAEFTSIKNDAGAYSLTAIKTFNYDKNGNVTEVKQYDWVASGDVARDSFGRPTGVPAAAVLKKTAVNDYYYPTPDSSSTAFSSNAYHIANSPNLRNAIATAEARNGVTPVARTEYFYDDMVTLTAGNLVKQTSWDSRKGGVDRPYSNPLTATNSISTIYAYDLFGNVTMTTDPKGNQTKFTYAAISGFADLYPTKIERAFGTALNLTTDKLYDFWTGLETERKDVDNDVKTTTSYDVIGRSVLVISAVGKLEETRTETVYSNVDRRIVVRSDLEIAGDKKLVSIKHYDQLGRVRLSRTLEAAVTAHETDETKGIKVQTRYQVSGVNSYTLASNPYRAATSSAASSEETMGWSRSKTDNGGRLTEVETFSGATLPAPWGNNTSSTGVVSTTYDANSTTVTDQALKKRRNVIDGLGRLIRVDEPNAAGVLDVSGTPVQPTNYTYNALNNLTQVQQIQGSPSVTQTRTFVYDSLSRLTSASNPESGVVNYTYDNNSNLSTRADSRPITTTYAYDALNRVISRTYSTHTAATPNAYYFYDAQALPSNAPPITLGSSKGRLIAITYGTTNASSTGSYYGYDKLGRPSESYQRLESQNYRFLYQYNKAGALTSETYPSGRVIETGYDPAGRAAGVKSQGSSFYYAGAAATDATNRIAYTPHGAMQKMQLGNTLIEQTNFNARLQLTHIKLGTSASSSNRLQLQYGYGTTDNNGNVKSQIIAMPKPAGGALVLTQSYTYDEINRLKSASETGGTTHWSETFNHDRFGNMWVTSPTGITLSPHTPQSVGNFAQATNRLAMGQTLYDDVGNLTKDSLGREFEYDAENRQYDYQNGATTYGYDGDGRRVRKQDATGTLLYIYNAMGQLIAEYLSVTPQPVGGGGTSYLTADHLGSTRVVTRGDGSVKARYDYLPFGEEVTLSRSVVTGFGGADSTKQKFTGHERDQESGLDFMQARYCSPMQGRFTSVDPENAGASPNDAQSWNGYAYARNNPMVYVDPTGLAYDFYRNGQWYRVNDASEFESYGYTVISGNEDGSALIIEDSNGNQFTAIFTDVPVNNPVQVYDQSGMSSLMRGVGSELARSEKASKQLIAGFIGVSGTAGISAGYAGAGILIVLAEGATTVKLWLEQQREIEIIASLDSERSKGVRRAWKEEAEMVRRTGAGTRNWSPPEINELLRTGKVKGYEGHHINDVHTNPLMASIPDNIKFVRGRKTSTEHISEHRGDFRNSTFGPLIKRK